MHGPTCIFWANLTPFSLQGAAAFEHWFERLSKSKDRESRRLLKAVCR